MVSSVERVASIHWQRQRECSGEEKLPPQSVEIRATPGGGAKVESRANGMRIREILEGTRRSASCRKKDGSFSLPERHQLPWSNAAIDGKAAGALAYG